MYLTIYCTKRFFMEFIRLDAVKTASGIGVTQIAMLIGALIGVVGGILYYKHGVLNLKRAEIKEEIAAAEEKAIAGKNYEKLNTSYRLLPTHHDERLS